MRYARWHPGHLTPFRDAQIEIQYHGGSDPYRLAVWSPSMEPGSASKEAKTLVVLDMDAKELHALALNILKALGNELTTTEA